VGKLSPLRRNGAGMVRIFGLRPLTLLSGTTYSVPPKRIIEDFLLTGRGDLAGGSSSKASILGGRKQCCQAEVGFQRGGCLPRDSVP